MNKFNLGDRVKVVNYGHKLWYSKSNNTEFPSWPILKEDDKAIIYDMNPEMIGKEGVVRISSETQGKPEYALEIQGKQAWYNEDQLELIKTKY